MLPPGVAGTPLGILRIRLLNCSIYSFTAASFHLWGTENSPAKTITYTKSADLPLIGTVHSVQKYLNDASPIAVKIMGGPDNHQIGVTSIPSVTLVDVMRSNRHYSLVIFESDTVQTAVGFLRLEISLSIQHQQLLTAKSISMIRDENEDETSKIDLLDELLDLCTDDLTAPSIPTTGTCATSDCTDPYDAWISRLEKQAASPPSEPFHNGSLLKVHVSEISIHNKLFDRFHGKICIYLKCSLKQQSDESSAVSKEMVVHSWRKQKSIRTKTPSKNEESIQLLDKPFDSEFNVEMEASKTKKDGSIELCLSCTAQKDVNTSAQSTPFKSQERICLATATIDLKSVLAKQQCGGSLALDMMSLEKENIKTSTFKAGALKMQAVIEASSEAFALKEQKKEKETALEEAQLKVQKKTTDLVSDTANVVTSRICQPHHPIASSLSEPNRNPQPHPVSVLLSNFMNAHAMKRQDQIKESHIRNNTTQPAERKKFDSSRKIDRVRCQPPEVVTSSNSLRFQPVPLPPLWIAIVVSKIELDSVADLRSLRLSCNIDTGLAFDVKKDQRFDTQCSWQFAVNDRELKTASVDVVVKSEDAEDYLAHVVLGIDDTEEYCNTTNGIPILNSGWFDVVDSSNHSLVGKIYIESCLGTLKQTRIFPEKCKLSVLIQQWWRKTLIRLSCTENIVTSEGANDSIHCSLQANILSSGSCKGKVKSTPSPSPEEQQYKDIDDNNRKNENVCSLVGTSVCLNTNNESPSSTDSLFEEWSRQSTTTSLLQPFPLNQQMAQTRQGPLAAEERIPKPLSCVFDDNESRRDLNETTRSSSIEQNNVPIDPPEDDEYSDCNSHIRLEREAGASYKLEDAGQENFLEDSTKGHEASSSTVAPNEFQVMVHARRIGGLNRLLTNWCEVEKTNALPVSGLFISVGNSNETSSEEVELHRIFTRGNMFHSQLISIKECNRELDLDDFRATMFIPNHDADLSLIPTQSLPFKLWFVPVVTRTVAEAFSNEQMSIENADILSGCKCIATAAIPLYDLYTSRAYFDGRVSWHLCGRDTSHGFITASVHKLNNDSPSVSNALNGEPSHIKPTNLQRSFCFSPEVTRRQSIDPPSCSSLSNKRKIDSGISARKSIKRSRVTETLLLRDATFGNARYGTGSESNPDITTANGQEVGKQDTIDQRKDSSDEKYDACDKAYSTESTSDQSKPYSAPSVASEGANNCHSSESTSFCRRGSEERGANTPTQDEQQGSLCVDTCERASSPVLVALRCQDKGVCTSPVEEYSNKKVDEPFSSSNKPSDSETVPVSNFDAKDDARYVSNKDDMDKQSNARSLNSCLERDDRESNSIRPRRLRSHVMHNYFASPRTNCNELGRLTSAKSPTLFPSTSSLLNRGCSALPNFRSPIASHTDHFPPDDTRPMRHKPATEFTSRSRGLSNRERIERIFSGKK